jgi:hypothetical protein
VPIVVIEENYRSLTTVKRRIPMNATMIGILENIYGEEITSRGRIFHSGYIILQYNEKKFRKM